MKRKIKMVSWKTKYGKSRDIRLFSVWRAMMNRCESRIHPAWKHYGGRGIGVCSDWCTFLNFRGWAISNGYRKGITLDRIDNDRGYMPSNCRWADWVTQRANRNYDDRGESSPNAKLTDDAVIEIRSENKPLVFFAEKFGVSVATISKAKRGLSWRHV